MVVVIIPVSPRSVLPTDHVVLVNPCHPNQPPPEASSSMLSNEAHPSGVPSIDGPCPYSLSQIHPPLLTGVT